MDARNFFELTVATAIALFGFRLGMAVGTVAENVRRRYTPEQWPMLLA
jgi:ACR3 family arsenite efflux pump ArsB